MKEKTDRFEYIKHLNFCPIKTHTARIKKDIILRAIFAFHLTKRAFKLRPYMSSSKFIRKTSDSKI